MPMRIKHPTGRTGNSPTHARTSAQHPTQAYVAHMQFQSATRMHNGPASPLNRCPAGVPMQTPYYRPSGRVPASAYPRAILVATGLIPFAWLYAWLIIHTPLIFNFFIAMAFSFAIGWLTKQVAAVGKVRNLAWISRAGIVLGLVGWYLQWAAWAALTISIHGLQSHPASPAANFITLVSQPWLLVQFALNVLPTGTMNISGWPLRGAWLASVWLAELWIHLMLAPMLGRMRVEEPFCEATNAWAKKIVMPRVFMPVDAEAARSRLETDPHAIRTMLTPAQDKTASHAEVALYRTGGPDAYLVLTNVLVTTGRKGNTESKRDPVVEYLRLPDTKVDELVAHLTACDSAEGAPIAPALAAALEHLQADRHADALAAAIDHVDGDASLRADARRICAIACCQLGRWDEAAAHFTALFEDEASAHNALQIATSSVMAGALPAGLAWIERAQALNDKAPEMPPMLLPSFVTALTQAGQETAAMPFVDQIRQLYTDLGCTDPTFLHLRSMPFFSSFLSNSLHVVRAALAPDEGRCWYAQMLPSLDAQGRAALDAWLEDEFGPATSQV